MASKLRRYKYTGPTTTRPSATTDSRSTSASDRTTPPDALVMDAETLKSEILLSLKADISTVIRSELKNALAEDFDSLKAELQGVKAEIVNNMAAIHSEVDQVKATLKDMEGGLSTWSDEVTTLQATVAGLKAELAEIREKCVDMEGRMRRCNIRILGVAETRGSGSTASVTKLLREVLQLDKDVLVDRSHRSTAPKRSDGKPRPIIAKLHYYQDCVEVLTRARAHAPLRFNGENIAIFPDYTASVAKARASFTEVRQMLRNRPGVRFGILFPARFRITYKGEEKEFTDAVKAMSYVKKYVISATETEG
ncbi:hypothetical protein NFI96_009875 [Prochilodus magdalenae]|nr:hypothetical protein NFI96_009875 [Prochilodus magdalenae]